MKLIVTVFGILIITSTTYAKSFQCSGDREFEKVKSTINLELGNPAIDEGTGRETLLGDTFKRPNKLSIEAEITQLGGEEVLTISVTRPRKDGTLDIKRVTGSTKGLVQYQDEATGGSIVQCSPN